MIWFRSRHPLHAHTYRRTRTDVHVHTRARARTHTHTHTNTFIAIHRMSSLFDYLLSISNLSYYYDYRGLSIWKRVHSTRIDCQGGSPLRDGDYVASFPAESRAIEKGGRNKRGNFIILQIDNCIKDNSYFK